jgi:hypothetical protein
VFPPPFASGVEGHACGSGGWSPNSDEGTDTFTLGIY